MTNRENTQRAIDSAMTAAELIEELKNLDPNTRVFFTCDYGDYCHTKQALPIRSLEEATTKQLSDTGYSQSRTAYNPFDEEDLEVYCEQCDEMWGGLVKCPVCGSTCVREDGTPTDEDSDDETEDIVVLSM